MAKLKLHLVNLLSTYYTNKFATNPPMELEPYRIASLVSTWPYAEKIWSPCMTCTLKTDQAYYCYLQLRVFCMAQNMQMHYTTEFNINLGVTT